VRIGVGLPQKHKKQNRNRHKMIELITGLPRSGKSYYAVHYLVDHYFQYDKNTDRWKKKKEYKDLTIITNIEGLALEHVDLDAAIEKSGLGYAGFFTKDYQTRIAKKYPRIVYAIDEVQEHFPDTFKNIDTRFYFEWHGHLGHDILLITQDRYRACRAIVSLSEFETRAMPRTLQLANELKYNIIAGGEVIDRKMLKPSKKIYRLYKSSHKKEHRKPKKVYIKYILVPICLTFFGLYICYRTFFAPDESKAAVDPPQPASFAKTQSTSLPSQVAPIPEPEFKRILIKGIVKMDGILYRVLDPVSGEMVDPMYLDYALEQRGRQIYAKLPLDLWLMASAGNLSDRSGPRGPGAESD
jgi:hypothetical protein